MVSSPIGKAAVRMASSTSSTLLSAIVLLVGASGCGDSGGDGPPATGGGQVGDTSGGTTTGGAVSGGGGGTGGGTTSGGQATGGSTTVGGTTTGGSTTGGASTGGVATGGSSTGGSSSGGSTAGGTGGASTWRCEPYDNMCSCDTMGWADGSVAACESTWTCCILSLSESGSLCICDMTTAERCTEIDMDPSLENTSAVTRCPPQ